MSHEESSAIGGLSDSTIRRQLLADAAGFNYVLRWTLVMYCRYLVPWAFIAISAALPKTRPNWWNADCWPPPNVAPTRPV